jgi:hypothetical protein
LKQQKRELLTLLKNIENEEEQLLNELQKINSNQQKQ